MTRIALFALLVPFFAACGEADALDPVPDAGALPPGCEDPAWMAGVCMPGEGMALPSEGAAHVSEPDAITWEANPPASGPHRPQWARWGEYSALGPDRWLHNMEHGGITLLYHPCAGTEVVDQLRAIARSMPADETGEFRWILAPYPELPTAVAVLAWEWRYTADCVNEDEIRDFMTMRYRQAPEDVRGDGAYDEGWLGR